MRAIYSKEFNLKIENHVFNQLEELEILQQIICALESYYNYEADTFVIVNGLDENTK